MRGDVFQDKLLNGEHVVWTGRPAQGILFTPRDAILIPFSLMWGGFAIFWETMVLRHGVPWFFVLWGVPFVLAGLVLIFGRFLIDAYLRARLYYAITDRRVLIVRDAPFPGLVSLTLTPPPQVQLVLGAGGRGTIKFGQRVWFGRGDMSAFIPALSATPQFIGIENAQAVLNAILGNGGAPAAFDGVFPFAAFRAPARPAVNGLRLALLVLVISSFVAYVSYKSVFCISSGGAGVHAVRSFATTQASFLAGDQAPVTRFGPDDTPIALVVLNWPYSARNGGSHRIVWNWYRDGQLVYSTRRCGMAFTSQPFTLRTWRSARELGGGHVRVDTLIDGRVAASTQFEVSASVPALKQGTLIVPWFCG